MVLRGPIWARRAATSTKPAINTASTGRWPMTVENR